VPVTVDELAGGKVLDIAFSGKLSRADYARFVPAVNRDVRKHRKVRLVVRMHDCHGWTMGALWADVRFDLRHFDHIERLAFVGDVPWESGLALFCRMLTTAWIRYFDEAHADDARAWALEGVAAAEPALAG